MKQFIETYKGIDIIYYDGYYYPDINGNVECEHIGGVRAWIDLYMSIPVWIRQGMALMELV